MYQRFTDRARKVMSLAEREAKLIGQSEVNPEHVLLGLIGEGSGVAAKVLKNSGLDLSFVRSEVKKHVNHSAKIESPESLPLSAKNPAGH